MIKVRIVPKNVNSKTLYSEINGIISKTIRELNMIWTNEEFRAAFIDGVETFLEERVQENKITQYKIICDNRNNKSFLESEEILFETRYKQLHCLNWTIINYYIRTKK